MNKKLFLSVIAVTAAIFTLAGCSKNIDDKESLASAESEKTNRVVTSELPKATYSESIGAIIEIPGALPEDKSSVMVSDFSMDVVPASDSDQPSAGMKFVNVRFEIINKGLSVISANPLADSSVVGLRNDMYTPVQKITTSGDPFPDASVISPNSVVSGIITFEIPIEEMVLAIRYVPNKETSEIAEWVLTNQE
jgi:hypothetical protein